MWERVFRQTRNPLNPPERKSLVAYVFVAGFVVFAYSDRRNLHAIGW